MIQVGKQRVIITNISPQIEEGTFPGKGAIGEAMEFSADIIVDGHDQIAASVFVRQLSSEEWQELPMKPAVNDRWIASFIPRETGSYEFRVEGWVDHFITWLSGLQKKADAGQGLRLEFEIGAALLEAAAAYSPENRQLLNWAGQFKDDLKTEESLELIKGAEMGSVMRAYRRAELVTVSGIYQFNVERKKAAYSTWYELFPRSASPSPGTHGTFNDVARLLPRIAKMGFDVLYFPPVHPIGEKNRKGKNNTLTCVTGDPGSPWAIGNYTGGHKAIHPELGTLADFKALVKSALTNKIEIAMDIAFQCAPDHPYVKDHPEWFSWRPDGTVQYAENPPKKYEDILPFNFESDDWQNLWLELKSVIDYWIDAGVNIFRIDNPHTKSFLFWEWLITEVRSAHPEVLFLAEAFTRPRVMERLAKAGFNQSYSYFTWRNTKKELEEYMGTLTKTDMRYYYRPNFWPNTPDILPLALINGGENAHIMRLILAATLSSNYGLYGPSYDFGINQPQGDKEEYNDNEKYEIKYWNWNAYSRIGEMITRVNRIRGDNPALQSTWNIEFAETNNDQVICYVKYDAPSNNLLIVAVNLDIHRIQEAQVKIPFYKFGIVTPESYLVDDLLSGEHYRWYGEWNFVSLNPYLMPAHIFRVEQLNN